MAKEQQYLDPMQKHVQGVFVRGRPLLDVVRKYLEIRRTQDVRVRSKYRWYQRQKAKKNDVAQQDEATS